MGGPIRINIQEIFYGTAVCAERCPSMMAYSFEVIVLWCPEAYRRRHCTKFTADTREFCDVASVFSQLFGGPASSTWWIVRSCPACTQASLLTGSS